MDAVLMLIVIMLEYFKVDYLEENLWFYKMAVINILVACWSVKITCKLSLDFVYLVLALQLLPEIVALIWSGCNGDIGMVCRNVNFRDGCGINVNGYQVVDIGWNILRLMILKEKLLISQNVNHECFSSLLKCENNLWTCHGFCFG